MKFQERKNSSLSEADPKPKTKGIILITDNRSRLLPENSKTIDFRQSAFRQTQIDPLSAWIQPNVIQEEDSLICQLNKRLVRLEERVQKLQKYSQPSFFSEKHSQNQNEKKLRRKFNQIDRNHKCHFQNCERVYGSQTSLRHHLKLKHQHVQNEQNSSNSNFKEKLIKTAVKNKEGLMQE